MFKGIVVTIGLAIGFAVPIPVSGQTFMGAGVVSCGEWLNIRSTGGNQANAFQASAWIDGFLSGVNAGIPGNSDFLASKPSSIALYAWVDNYCRSHPLDPLRTAALALANELQSRTAR
jgi:hypothetical protein